MEVYTIGFGGHSAEQFFRELEQARVERLLDVRRNNVSQLAGFTKRDDLRYFLKRVLGVDYAHSPELAPSSELLKSYRAKEIDWDEFSRRFVDELAERHVEDHFSAADFLPRTVLLCSEPTAERCHRRLVLEYLIDHGIDSIEPVHL